MARTLSQYWSSRRSRDGRPSLMSSCTAMLSTTENAIPLRSIISPRRSSLDFGQTSPMATS
jgi:hypothetical protein